MGERTPFAGLWQPEPGDDISSNNYEFYENIGTIDQMFQIALTRHMDGTDAVLPFASGPSLVASAIDGALSAGDVFWVGITAVDAYGGETTVMTASATVPGGTDDPTDAPDTAVNNDGTGTMTAGTYRYVYTIISGGGESEPSPVAEATILTDGRITVTPPAGVTGSFDWRLYRSFGYSDFSRVGTTFSSGTASATDDGESYSIYYDQQPPDENLTGETGSIEITRPAMPTDATGWKVYVGIDPNLPSPSYLADIDGVTLTNGVIDDSDDVVVFEDINQLAAGAPPLVSRTVGGGAHIAAANVDYAGSGVVAGGGLGSGSVEWALDTLVGRTAVRVRSVAAGSAGVQASGDIILVGSGNVSVSASGRVFTIYASGGTGTGGVSSLNSASGNVTIVGASGNIVRQDYGASSIIIEGTTVRASGATALRGDVQLVGGSGIALSEVAAASSITIHSTLRETSVRKGGDTRLYGDIQFAGGTGITISQDGAGSALTISATGSGPASAGVNSIKLDGEPGVIDGNVILYEGAGIDITQMASGFTVAATAVPTVLIHGAAGSAYAPSAHVYAGSGITLVAEASGITINASGHARRFGHSFAIGGTLAVASGDTDFIPPFWVPVGPKQLINLISVETQINGSSSASIASATVLRNGVALASLNDINISTTAALDTASANVVIADMDKLSLRIDLVTGTPKNLSATLVFEETIIP